MNNPYISDPNEYQKPVVYIVKQKSSFVFLKFLCIIIMFLLLSFGFYLIVFEGEITLFPFSEEHSFLQVEKSFKRNDYEKTYDSILDYLEEYPNGEHLSSIFLYLGQLLFIKGDIEASSKYTLKAFALTEQNSEQRVDTSLLLAQIVLKTKKTNSTYLHFIEEAYFFSNGEKKEELALDLAYLYLLEKDYNSALTYFSRVFDERAYIGRANVYIKEGNLDKAIEEMIDMFRYFPLSEGKKDYEDLFTNLVYQQGRLLQTNHNDQKAVDVFIAAYNIFPQNYKSIYGLIEIAKIYYENKQYDQALSMINLVIDTPEFEKNVKAWFIKGEILAEMDEKKAAYYAFRVVCQVDPNGPYTKKALEWINLIVQEYKYL